MKHGSKCLILIRLDDIHKDFFLPKNIHNDIDAASCKESPSMMVHKNYHGNFMKTFYKIMTINKAKMQR